MLFSCFSKAREAVKRTSEVEFSYIELTFKDGHLAQSEMCWVPVIFALGARTFTSPLGK